MPQSRIQIQVWTARFLGTREHCYDFLDLIDTFAGGALKPARWNYFEPLQQSYTCESQPKIVSRWTHERSPGWVSNLLFFRRKKPRVEIALDIWRSSRPLLNSAHITLAANSFRDPDMIVHLVKKLIGWSNAVYATVRHTDQQLWLVAQLTPLARLQQLEWLTYFGQPYVLMFGEDRIRTAGFHALEDFGGGIMALSAGRPDDHGLARISHQ